LNRFVWVALLLAIDRQRRERFDMSYTHKMQTNRREFKYIVSESTAAGIRDFVRFHLIPDEYADPNNYNSYWIHSLYLDNPSLTLCNATLEGLKNRFKLRIRFYDDKSDDPVFFEVKSRVNDVILKERCAVHRASVDRLLHSPWAERSDLVKYNPKNLASLQRFLDLQNKLKAEGKVFVTYMREAYVSPHDDSVRVTFDRNLSSAPYNKELRVEPLPGWVQPKVDGVVLELKFTDRFPGWMGDLTRTFGLVRGTMAKYVYCVQSLGHHKLLHR
jgi:SPX domain protein involved in polyphosphate accumulation